MFPILVAQVSSLIHHKNIERHWVFQEADNSLASHNFRGCVYSLMSHVAKIERNFRKVWDR